MRYAGAPAHSGATAVEFTPVEWASSHSWVLGDSLVVVVRRSCPPTPNTVCIYYLHGLQPPLDTIVLTQFSGFEVPTVNSFSYSSETGEVNTMFAPVWWTAGGTVEITGRAHFRSGQDIERVVRVVLH